MTVIVPPWFVPGAGVIVLVIARLVRHGRATTIVARRPDQPPLAPPLST